MSQFRVHVQQIAYGWCDIELYINDEIIKCGAGYLGPHPLNSLIDACFSFFTAEHEEDEEFIQEEFFTWEEEPDAMQLHLRLHRDGMVYFDIQERDDDKNLLEEWHEKVPFEDFRKAIVSEGFRVLNVFGLYGYRASWMGQTEFPLSSLLYLTGQSSLIWNGDVCRTSL